MGYDHRVSRYARLKGWYHRSTSSLAMLARDVAPIVKPRAGWLSSTAGGVLTVTAWQVSPIAAGVVAAGVLLIAEWRVSK